jgi:hypothetical protein
MLLAAKLRQNNLQNAGLHFGKNWDMYEPAGAGSVAGFRAVLTLRDFALVEPGRA